MPLSMFSGGCLGNGWRLRQRPGSLQVFLGGFGQSSAGPAECTLRNQGLGQAHSLESSA